MQWFVASYNASLYKCYTNKCIVVLFCFVGKDITASNCSITPLNPFSLLADGRINNGTPNVMIKCNCTNTDYRQIRWYSPDKKEIPFQLSEPGDLPYFVLEKGTLIIPIFNDSYQGTYYCGVKNGTANISLTLWTQSGMYVYV